MGDGVNVTDFDTGKELLDVNIYMDKPNNDPEVLFQQSQDIRSKLTNTQFEPGYTWEIGGETSAQSDIFKDLGKLAIVVVFLILLLITMQFYSVSTPLIIMTTVYLAAAGESLEVLFQVC